MTNDATNFMPLAGFGGFDYLTAGTQPSEKGVAPAQRNTCRLWNQPGDPPWLGRGELVIKDFSQQGYNHLEGDFSINSNGFAWSDLVTNRANELVPPPAIITLTDAAISGNIVGFHTRAAFSTVFMALGSAANHALFKETSTTDPTPVAITYSPAAEICSMARTLASGAERLAVGHVGAAVKFFSDAAGTVSATGDATTNSCWGIIMSGVNANAAKPGTPQLLLYCGTTIGYISSDVAMTTAVTVSHTGVNAGGWAIGAIKAQGRAQMAYWGIPQVTTTAGAMKFGAEVYCDIYATPMDGGTDFLPITLNYLPNGVLFAIPFRDGILAHDGVHVVYWDGNNEYDLGVFGSRLDPSTHTQAAGINHDISFNIRGLIVNGAQCGVVYQWSSTNIVHNGQVHAEMYQFEKGSWHNANTRVAMGANSLLVYLCNGSAMSSTGHRYWWASSLGEDINGAFIPREAESLLWQYSLGSGATTNTAMPTFTNNTSLLGCRWHIDQDPPGVVIGTRSIERSAKVIYECEFNGNLDYGGTSWSFQVQVYGFAMDGVTRQVAYNKTFSQGQPASHYLQKNPASAWANVQDIQLLLTAVASGTSRQLPLLSPFTVRFAYIKDMTWKEGGVTMYPPAAITAENAPMLLGTQGQA